MCPSNLSLFLLKRATLTSKHAGTKLSAWLALGCVTARQIHQYLLNFEEGKTDLGKGVQGYGKGENKGTSAVRFELLWRDYFRLTTRKFGSRLFQISGLKNDTSSSWSYPQKDKEIQRKVTRFMEGTTGTGLIDASMKELFCTGYTSNRARQNVASVCAFGVLVSFFETNAESRDMSWSVHSIDVFQSSLFPSNKQG